MSYRLDYRWALRLTRVNYAASRSPGVRSARNWLCSSRNSLETLPGRSMSKIRTVRSCGPLRNCRRPSSWSVAVTLCIRVGYLDMGSWGDGKPNGRRRRGVKTLAVGLGEPLLSTNRRTRREWVLPILYIAMHSVSGKLNKWLIDLDRLDVNSRRRGKFSSVRS